MMSADDSKQVMSDRRFTSQLGAEDTARVSANESRW
jgi:hypothetical protein